MFNNVDEKNLFMIVDECYSSSYSLLNSFPTFIDDIQQYVQHYFNYQLGNFLSQSTVFPVC